MAMKLNDALEATRGVTTFRIPLDKVKVKAGFNTRFGDPNPGEYARLKELIRKNGQEKPADVLVLPDKTVQLVDGNQRYKILCELEAEDPQGRTLWVIPFQGNEAAAKERSIDANLATGLSIMDNVSNWDYLIRVLGRTVPQVADKYKISPASVTEGLKLLQLDKKHQILVHKGDLSQAMALRLVKYPVERRDEILQKMEEIRADRVAKADAAMDAINGGTEVPRNVVPMPSPVPAAPEAKEPAAPEHTPALAPAARRANTAAVEPPAPKTRTRTVKTATEADLLKAAEQVGAQTGEEPPRKMKELVTFFDEFLETTPKCAATDLVRDLKAFIARKITEQQMENRLMKHTDSVLGEVINDKKGGKK